MLFVSLGTKLNEIWFEMHSFSFHKCISKCHLQNDIDFVPQYVKKANYALRAVPVNGWFISFCAKSIIGYGNYVILILNLLRIA